MSSSQERSAAKSFVERHGLWSEEQFEAAARAERLIEERRPRGRAAVVPRPARHPARQDRDGRRRRQGDAQRLLDHHDAARQGHLAQDRVPGVHRRRRLRHAGDAGRRRFPDDRRPDDLPRAAVGAADRLGAVRHLFPGRQAGAVLDAPSLSAGAATGSAMPASTTSPASKSNSTSSRSRIRGSRRPTPAGRASRRR